MLRRLGMKRGDATGLKNAELVSQLGPHLQRLVWEADWDAKVELVVSNNDATSESSSLVNDELTLRGSTILADLIRSSVDSYVTDSTLVQAADLAFVGTVSERRYATKSRRMVGAKDSDLATGNNAGETISTLASIGGISKVTTTSSTGNDRDEKPAPSSAVAVTSIKDTIGSRPKLLGATLDMLIAEHATKGGGIGYIKTLTSVEKKEHLSGGSITGSTIMGGSTNLSCSLVADILLAYGKLPRSYEVLIIMTRILDASVQAGSISDNAIAQIQGCLRTIFRPSKSEQQSQKSLESPSKDRAEGTKIKLSLKSPSKASSASSMFPDLPADDSDYERKLLQRVIKKAIAFQNEHDPQVRFPFCQHMHVIPEAFLYIHSQIFHMPFVEFILESSNG